MSEFVRSEELEKLAAEVLEDYDLEAEGVDILYLVSGKSKRSKGKVCFADTEKIKPKVRSFVPYDFIITFYADSQYLSRKAKRILMLHELRHVGWDGEKTYIIHHDVEDFRGIVETYGLDWTTIGEEEGQDVESQH